MKIVKFGEMKYDVPFETLGHHTEKYDFTVFEDWRIRREGQRLYNSRYDYLKEDPWVKTDKDFYRSVTYAYMVDQILKINPVYKKDYDKVIADHIKGWSSGHQDVNRKAAQAYSWYNRTFIRWYCDQLREQKNPGILEKERENLQREMAEGAAEMKRKTELNHIKEKLQEQQDLASGKRVVCPYCHSTDTEKISTMSRAVSVSLVGAASGKIGKQWHCKQCGSDF